MVTCFRFNVKHICTKNYLVFINLGYSPRKFRNLPEKYCRLNVENDNEVWLFKKALRTYCFDCAEEDEQMEQLWKKDKDVNNTTIVVHFQEWRVAGRLGAPRWWGGVSGFYIVDFNLIRHGSSICHLRGIYYCFCTILDVHFRNFEYITFQCSWCWWWQRKYCGIL